MGSAVGDWVAFTSNKTCNVEVVTGTPGIAARAAIEEPQTNNFQSAATKDGKVSEAAMMSRRTLAFKFCIEVRAFTS